MARIINTPFFYINKKSKYQSKDYAIHFKGILSGLSIGPRATNEKECWLIASLKWPWSITWRWLLSVRWLPFSAKRPFMAVAYHKSNRGITIDAKIDRVMFRFATQQNCKPTSRAKGGEFDFDEEGSFYGFIDTIFIENKKMYITVSTYDFDQYFSLSIPFDRKTSVGDEISGYRNWVYIGDEERPVKTLSAPLRVPIE